jgi:hypothetical protein
VWQPNASQWRLIFPLGVALVLFWPSASEYDNRSLALKLAGWAADPADTLPHEPSVLSIADEDDVAAIDAQAAQQEQYDKVYKSSAFARLRLRLRDAQEPFDPSTERQILVAVAALGGLLTWRLGSRHS